MKINIESVKTARSTISNVGNLLDTALSQVYIGDNASDDVKNRAYSIRNRLKASRDNCNVIISKIDSFINDYDEASKNILELLNGFSVNTFGSFINNLSISSNDYTNNVVGEENDILSDEEAASLVRLSSNLSNLSSDTLEDKINSLDISSDDKQYLIEQYGKGNERAGDLRLMEIVLEKELENEKNNLSNLEVELDNKEKEKSSLFNSLKNKYYNSSSYNNIGREGDIKTSDAQNKAHNDSNYLILETEYNELKSKRDDAKQYISSLENQIKQYKQKRLEYEYDYMLDIDADKTNYNFEGDSSYWTEDEKYSNMIVFEGFSSEVLRYYINFYENNPDARPKTNPEFYLSYAALFMYSSENNNSMDWIVPMNFGNDIADPDCFQIYTEKRMNFNNDLLENTDLSDISSVKQYVADNYNSDDLYVKDLLTYLDENSNVDLKNYLENDNTDYTGYCSILENCKISVPENQEYDYAYETGLTYNNTMSFSRALLKLQVEGKIPDTVFNYRDDYQDGLSVKTYYDSNSILFSNLNYIDNFGNAALLFDDSQMNVFYYLFTHEGLDAAQKYLNTFDYETSRSFFNERSGYYKAEEMFYKIVNSTDDSFIKGLITSDIQGFKLGFENYFDSVETLFDKYGTMTDSEYAIMYLNSMLGSMSYFIPLSASDIEGMANEGLIDKQSSEYVDLFFKANNGLRVTYLDILHANGTIDDISFQSFSELGNDQKIKDFIDRNNTDGGFLGYNRLEWLQHFVNIGQSAGYMAPSLITSMYLGAAGVGENLSQAAGLAVMFLGCMSSSKNQALREGTSLGMAYLYGLLSGGSEVLTEYAIGGLTGLSRLSKYFNVPGITKPRTVGRLLLQYFVLGNLEECAEELVQGAILSPLIDYSILGKEYSFTLEEAKDTIATTWISTMQMNLASTIITAPSTIKKSGYAATIKMEDGTEINLSYNDLLKCTDNDDNIDMPKLLKLLEKKSINVKNKNDYSQILDDVNVSNNTSDIDVNLLNKKSDYWNKIRNSGKSFFDKAKSFLPNRNNVDSLNLKMTDNEVDAKSIENISTDSTFNVSEEISEILRNYNYDSIQWGSKWYSWWEGTIVTDEITNKYFTLNGEHFDFSSFAIDVCKKCKEIIVDKSVSLAKYNSAVKTLSNILSVYDFKNSFKIFKSMFESNYINSDFSSFNNFIDQISDSTIFGNMKLLNYFNKDNGLNFNSFFVDLYNRCSYCFNKNGLLDAKFIKNMLYYGISNNLIEMHNSVNDNSRLGDDVFGSILLDVSNGRSIGSNISLTFLDLSEWNDSFVDLDYLKKYYYNDGNDFASKFNYRAFVFDVIEKCRELMSNNPVGSSEYNLAIKPLQNVLNILPYSSAIRIFKNILDTRVSSMDTDAVSNDRLLLRDIEIINYLSDYYYYLDSLCYNWKLGYYFNNGFTSGINVNQLIWELFSIIPKSSFNNFSIKLAKYIDFKNVSYYNETGFKLKGLNVNAQINNFIQDFVLNNLSINDKNVFLDIFNFTHFYYSELAQFMDNNGDSFDLTGFLEFAFRERKLSESDVYSRIQKFDFVKTVLDKFSLNEEAGRKLLQDYIDELSSLVISMHSLSYNEKNEKRFVTKISESSDFREMSFFSNFLMSKYDIRIKYKAEFKTIFTYLSEIQDRINKLGNQDSIDINGINVNLYGSNRFIENIKPTISLLYSKLPDVYKVALKNLGSLIFQEYSNSGNPLSFIQYESYFNDPDEVWFTGGGLYHSKSNKGFLINDGIFFPSVEDTLNNLDGFNILLKYLLHELGHKIDRSIGGNNFFNIKLNSDYSNNIWGNLKRSGTKLFDSVLSEDGVNKYDYSSFYSEKHTVTEYGDRGGIFEDFAEFSSLFGYGLVDYCNQHSDKTFLENLNNFEDKDLMEKYKLRFIEFKNALMKYYINYSDNSLVRNAFGNKASPFYSVPTSTIVVGTPSSVNVNSLTKIDNSAIDESNDSYLNRIASININKDIDKVFSDQVSDAEFKTVDGKGLVTVLTGEMNFDDNGILVGVSDGTTIKYGDESFSIHMKDGVLKLVDSSGNDFNIFGDYNDASVQYGANQMAFAFGTLLGDEKTMTALHKYFPDCDAEQAENVLNKLVRQCGYMSLTNAVFKEMEGKESEFKNIFGIDQYTISKDLNGNIIFHINYEPIAMELFCSGISATGTDLMSIEYGSSPSERKAAYQYFIKKYSEKSKTLFNGKSFEEFCDTNHVYQVNNGHYYDQKYKSSGEPFVVLRSPDNKRENVFTGGHSMSFIIDNSAFCSSWGHKWFMKASRYLPMNQKFENVSISHNEKVWLDKVSILDSNGVSHEWDSIWYMYNR